MSDAPTPAQTAEALAFLAALEKLGYQRSRTGGPRHELTTDRVTIYVRRTPTAWKVTLWARQDSPLRFLFGFALPKDAEVPVLVKTLTSLTEAARMDPVSPLSAEELDVLRYRIKVTQETPHLATAQGFNKTLKLALRRNFHNQA